MLEFNQEIQKQGREALLTIMTTNDESIENHEMGSFNKDPETQEMMHYTEGGKITNLTVNCGVYLCSSKLFDDKEFIKSLKLKEYATNMAQQRKKLAK